VKTSLEKIVTSQVYNAVLARLLHSCIPGVQRQGEKLRAKGINFFNTGHSYSDGNAEPRLGKALRDIPNKNDLYISSKAGTRIGEIYAIIKQKSIRILL